MIAKEWQEARWKFVVGMLLFLALVAANLSPYEFIRMNIEIPPLAPDGSSLPSGAQVSDPLEWAITNLWFSYSTGKSALALLAIVLGIGFFSAEASRGTIFLLLSKPVGRVRVFFAKYVVGALILLAIAALGNIGLILIAAYKGYPLGHMSMTGVTLSTLLLWLGSLSILGLALLISVVFDDVIRSALVGLAFTLMVFVLPLDLDFGAPDERINRFLAEADPEPTAHLGLARGAALTFYWSSENLYQGKALAPTHFLVCLIAAVLPLVGALWMFKRKAY